MLDSSLTIDHYGRIIIQDAELLLLISGAVESHQFEMGANAACGNDAACSNSSC